ncbi:hypothetical protein CJO92_05865 [Ralstonia solanacearum]|uniref:Uncharacterized protein n=2 Tax=Ralstonia solanacearum TaxID=305 RepID=A0AAD0S871_RALSL|nr:hypothetical protein CJO77_05865 [Ralstonia solanacearum]AXW52257.1 hypothetical protein CJO92_05865 [Ralstonia solanacearum]
MKMRNTTSQLPAALQTALAEYQNARGEFEAARDEAGRIAADMQQHRAAADAAEAEAQQVRQDAAQRMRNAAASPQDLRDLKAKERAAYTTAEDYRAIVTEFEQAHDNAKIKAGLAKLTESTAYRALLRTYADTLMNEVEPMVAPLLRAIAVQERAYAAEADRGTASWEHARDNAADAALARMYGVIQRAFAGFTFDSAGDGVLQAATRPTGRDLFLPISPAATHVRNTLRQAAAQQQRGHTA